MLYTGFPNVIFINGFILYINEWFTINLNPLTTMFNNLVIKGLVRDEHSKTSFKPCDNRSRRPW